MLLLTIVYDNEREDIIDGIKDLREYFKHKNVLIGISESIESDTHFLKIFCDEEINNRLKNLFNIHIATMLYNIVIDEFYKRDITSFLSDTYFFLKYDEIKEIKEESLKVLKQDGKIVDENSIYCINKKNSIIDKIVECISENKEININGFVTFRMKELMEDIEGIIDKVVEKYMVEREYNEFIKLLKYFVEIQESKLDYLSIGIKEDGSYLLEDKDGLDISEKLFDDLSELKYKEDTNVEDILISSLITNSPEKIVIHCVENCRNRELIDTIKKVFTNRVTLCNDCGTCRQIKDSLNKV